MIQGNLLFALEQIHTYIEREEIIETELKALAEKDPRCKRLDTIPGFGLMSQLAFIAVIDDSQRFADAKHFASYLGLVPREYSSGDKRRMGSITRSGSEILRRYLIHGARTTLMHSLSSKYKSDDPNRRWAVNLKHRIGMNKATVALAHRMARIGFSLLKDELDYNPNFLRRAKVAA
jgi:transposase